MRIGIISDTHGYLDRMVFDLFAGVHRILHAGDIGWPGLILELEAIAPVTAVLGNNDAGLNFLETEVLRLGRHKVMVHHEIQPHAPGTAIHRRIIQEEPDLVVFGHTHQSFCEKIGPTVYLNPGYAGRPRINQLRTVAILDCARSGLVPQFHSLGDFPVEHLGASL
jgi:uncharacterized protein